MGYQIGCNCSETKLNDIESVVGSYLSAYMGLVFEDICRQYLILHPEKMPFPIAAIGEWWETHPGRHKEVRVDIVAVGVKENNTQHGRQFIIGSCKYKNEEIGLDEWHLLLDYASVFTNGVDDCFYIIFSKSGFTNSLKELADNGKVALIGLEEIYKA